MPDDYAGAFCYRIIVLDISLKPLKVEKDREEDRRERTDAQQSC